MEASVGVLYTGILMAVSLGMTAWRMVTAEGGKLGTFEDRMLGACLAISIGLFVGVLLPNYVEGFQLP